ncbi:MAG TPA: hypothetical protein VGB87_06010 [Vicinamibacteria bacterium]
MSDRLEDLQSAVRELRDELRRLEARVRELEGRGGKAAARRAAAQAEPAAAIPAVAVSQGTVGLAGRTLLVLAGGYVARALTDAQAVPQAVGAALGLAYAVFWLLRADGEAGRGRRESASFHALAGSLIAFPLLWETAARFSLLGPRAAAAAVAGFFALGLWVAWRRGLGVVACIVTGLAVATALALLVATHDLAAAFGALLAVAAGLEWLAYRDRWLPLRWGAAAVLDVVAFLIAALVGRAHGLPEGYAPFSPAAAAGALLGLPALYVASLAARTLRRERPVTLFEVAQGSLAILLGFGGAYRLLASQEGAVAGLSVLALVLGSACYGVAFAFAERRPGRARNFYFYSTAAGLLILGGVNAVAFGPVLPLAFAGLGLAAAALGRRFGRMTLRVHSALYLAAGALETGLLGAGVRALAGQPTGSLLPLSWVVGLAAAGSWAMLATDPGAPRSGWARGPQLVLAVLVALAAGKALQTALWVAFGERLAGDFGLSAAARTAVLAALVLVLALASRRWAWPELAWLVYPLVALSGLKVLLQDVREGRPFTLVLSLALYGTVLLLAPRLLKRADRDGRPPQVG